MADPPDAVALFDRLTALFGGTYRPERLVIASGGEVRHEAAVALAEEHFGDLVYETRIRKTVRYAEAPVKGSSVLKYDPTGPAAQAYRDLAKEVLDGAQARDDA